MQDKTLPGYMVNAIPKLIEPWFLFSFVWSVGGTCDGNSRQKFDQFLRKKIEEEKVCITLRYGTAQGNVGPSIVYGLSIAYGHTI